MAFFHWSDYCNRHLESASAFSGRKPFPMPGAKPKYTRDKQFNLHHIKIEVAIDHPKGKITGTSSLTLSPVLDGLESVTLDAVDLKILGVKLNGSQSLEFDPGNETFRVKFASALKAGQQVTLAVDYEGHPRKGLYFVGPDAGYPGKMPQIWTQGEDMDTRYWAPCYDFPNLRATSEVIATVPEKWFALSNGKLVKTTHNQAHGTKTYHWSQQQPHVTYLITLAAGEFVELDDSKNGIPMRYYVPPGMEEKARRTLGNTPKAMDVFQKLIGIPYPWDKYDQICVEDFIFGGMENTSATTLTDMVLHDARAHLDFTADPLVAHELAHQWFGDLLTCKDWSHAWLNEGFATYFEALFTEQHLGEDEFKLEMFHNAQNYFGEDGGRYRRPIVTRVYDDPVELFDRHLYEKGSLVLHMLRYLLGDDLFFRSIKRYVEKHRNGVVDTEDLRRAIEETTGKTMERFFDQWVHKAGHPNFKVSYAWDDDTKLATVVIAQTQEADAETSIFHMPVVVDFHWEGGSKSFKFNLEEKEHRYHIPLEKKPLMARFDPSNRILKTLEEEAPKEMHLYRLKKDPDCMGRITAAHALAKVGSQDCIDALKNAVMTDAFWGVAAEAADALGAVKSRAAGAALIGCLAVKHPKARRAVVNALAEFKEEAVADAMVKILEHGDESYFVEGAAAHTLGKIKSPKALDVLKKTMAKDSFMDVIRSGALTGLADLKDERGLEVAKEWSKYGHSEPVRMEAISTVARLGEDKKETVDFLTDYLTDPQLRVRLRTAVALESLGDGKAIGRLSAQVDREVDGRVRRRFKEAVASIRQGSKGKEEVTKLREDLDKLSTDNKALRERVEKMEARLTPAKTEDQPKSA